MRQETRGRKIHGERRNREGTVKQSKHVIGVSEGEGRKVKQK